MHKVEDTHREREIRMKKARTIRMHSRSFALAVLPNKYRSYYKDFFETIKRYSLRQTILPIRLYVLPNSIVCFAIHTDFVVRF
jgi:hypothetical protein